MVECQSCGRKHPPGTLFCSKCGIYLATGGTLQTDPLPEDELPSSEEASPWANVPIEKPEDTSTIPIPLSRIHQQSLLKVEELSKGSPVPLRIKVISTGREIQLPLTDEVHIGRLDAAHDIFPDLDLTSDAKPEDGISRRHCKIHRRGSIYLVEDVGSANGTFLNGLRLNPHLLHVLKHGDELQLGRIKMRIILQA